MLFLRFYIAWLNRGCVLTLLFKNFWITVLHSTITLINKNRFSILCCEIALFQDCPTWTEWGFWTNCSSGCNGQRFRLRECGNEGSRQTDRCQGNSRENQTCNIQVSFFRSLRCHLNSALLQSIKKTKLRRSFFFFFFGHTDVICIWSEVF